MFRIKLYDPYLRPVHFLLYLIKPRTVFLNGSERHSFHERIQRHRCILRRLLSSQSTTASSPRGHLSGRFLGAIPKVPAFRLDYWLTWQGPLTTPQKASYHVVLFKRRLRITVAAPADLCRHRWADYFKRGRWPCFFQACSTIPFSSFNVTTCFVLVNSTI